MMGSRLIAAQAEFPPTPVSTKSISQIEDETGSAPQTLHLPDGGLVLSERSGDLVRLIHLHTGEEITLSGVFAERLGRHLDSPDTEPFPKLGPLLHQHHWLEQLKSSAMTTVSDLLLGKGLGMLFVELTSRCNERCVHCYAESSPERSDSLSREEIYRVLHQARSLGEAAVQFTGGDPLLHPELVYAVQTAHELGCNTLEIYTNGLALNDALLARLLPFEPSFAFSIYASDTAVHDAITQTPGSLMRTMRAMRRVQAAGLSFRIGLILMPENSGTEQATIDFLQREFGLDASRIGIDVVRSTGRGRYMHADGPHLSGLQPFRHLPSKSQSMEAPPRRGKLCVAASGDVFPCIFSRRVRLGSIREQSLAEILATLAGRALASPSAERWQQCRESLSCSDCQAIAYLLGDGDNSLRIPIEQEGLHAA